jgi:hypothetical protein
VLLKPEYFCPDYINGPCRCQNLQAPEVSLKLIVPKHSKSQCFSNPPTGMTVKHMTVRDDYSLPYHHLNTKTEDSLQEHNPER